MENCEIDWDLAPEWAIAHALLAYCSEISEVWVGEDKWQRLTQGKSFPYGGGGGDAHHNPTRKQFKYETPRPAPWNGEGLPPVGTVCEVQHPDRPDTWCKCTILVWGSECAVFSADANYPFAYDGNGYPESFRPIRTPEQIAAEDRAQAIDEMLKALTLGTQGNMAGDREAAEILYDAGYRKQVKP